MGIAAPVFDHRGQVAGAVMIAAPYYRVPREEVPRLAEACTAAARRISGRMGSGTA